MSGSSAVKEVLREVAVWGGVFACGFGLFYYSDPLIDLYRRGLNQIESFATSAAPERQNTWSTPPANGFDRVVRVRADPTGHFGVRGWVNGRALALMADTGATFVALTYEDAERLGLHPRFLDYSGQASTANGVARVAPVRLGSLRVDDIEVRDVPAMVMSPGALQISLLGMSFLSRLKRFEVAGRELVLTQ